MPIEYRDIDGGLGSFWEAWGVLTDDEFMELSARFFSQDAGKLKKYKFNLSDYSAVERTELSTRAVRQEAEMALGVASINPESIIAIIAPQDILFGLARMWTVFTDEANWETRVFRNRGDAEEWLRRRVEEKYGISDLRFA